MGQIVKRKKKGRPSKADLAKRRNSAADKETPDRELRRSHRQRSVRYTFGFDDYLEDEELFEDFEDEEDERRREKKLKFLLKLQSSKETTTTESAPSRTRRVSHAPTASQSSSECGGDRSQPSKKRKIDCDDEGEEDEDENEDNENIEDDEV